MSRGPYRIVAQYHRVVWYSPSLPALCSWNHTPHCPINYSLFCIIIQYFMYLIFYVFRYMERRCKFLDNFPGYNYNNGFGEYIINKHGQKRRTDTTCLGSTLMNTMLKEVSEFCDPSLKDNWSHKPHQQVKIVLISGFCSYRTVYVSFFLFMWTRDSMVRKYSYKHLWCGRGRVLKMLYLLTET